MKKKIFNIVAALNLETGQEQLPVWYCIFPEGVQEVEGFGEYLVDRTAWEMVQARLLRRGVDIVFDYEHQTLADTKAPAAGWCKEWRYQAGVGIEARIHWTDTAAGHLKSGEYRYFSPVFQVRRGDKRIYSVHSVALTNAPRTNNIKPLLAKLGAQLEDKEHDMDLLKMMIAALKLKEDATNDDVIAAVAGIQKKSGVKAKEVISKAVIAALGIDKDDESTVVASIHALKQTGKTMVSRADFDALQARLNGRDAKEVVAKAMSVGKITPDQLAWATKYATDDLDGFTTFVAKAPVVVPVGELGAGGGAGYDQPASDAVLAVAKMMDVDEADLKTYGGLEQ